MLDVRGIDTYYGQSHILFDVSLSLRKGEIVACSAATAREDDDDEERRGPAPAERGDHLLEGEDVTGRKPFQLVRRGICYVPDDRRIFSDLTVDDNLGIVYGGPANGPGEGVRPLPGAPGDRRPAGGGLKRRRKGHARGGAGPHERPKLLLLDEPTEGLAPLIVRALEEQILRLKEEGISILLSEQNLKSSLRLIDRAYIIDNGRIRYQGRRRSSRTTRRSSGCTS